MRTRATTEPAPPSSGVYFDDFKVTVTPTAVIQSNDYYAFGLQHATSWTRDNTNNNFLYDAGSELNNTTGMYDLPYRNYDATLGRFFQVDQLATSSHDLNPYHYAANNPIGANDPSGLNVDYSTSMENPSYVQKLQEEWNLNHMNTLGSENNLWDLTMSFFGMSMAEGSNPKGGSNSVTSVVRWKDGKDYLVTVDKDGNYYVANANSPIKGVDLGDFIGVITVKLVNEPVISEADLKQGYGSNGGGELTQTEPGYGGGKDSGTLRDFLAKYSGCTIEQVQNEMDAVGSFNSQPSGPTSIRFVQDPLNPDKYIDMRHMLVVGYEWGNLVGLGVEIIQLFRFPASAF